MCGLALQVLPEECISPYNAVMITMPGTVLTRDLQQKPDGQISQQKYRWKIQAFPLACCHFKVLFAE